MGADGTRGILNPIRGRAHFSLEREDPPQDLAPFVDRFWSVCWDLEGQSGFEQEVLPHPCVNLSFQDGAFEVHGPGTQRFVAHLTGRGCVFGTKFTPAGFFAFAREPMRRLVDRVVSVSVATGCAPPLPSAEGSAPVRAAVSAFLRARAPSRADRDEAVAVNRLIAAAQEDRSIARADHLARLAGMSVRSLHRLLERHVGVGPKWIVRRARVQEAAERIAHGTHVDWSELAQELGYHDQSHFIRDFRAQVGATPAAYARRCREAVILS